MIFFGIEKEGKYKGLKTLFVGGAHSIEEVLHYAEMYNCEHIYLGAGRKYSHTLSEEDIVRLLTIPYIISFEVTYKPELSDEILSKIHVIYTIKQGSFPLELGWMKKTHSIKVEDNDLVLIFPIENGILNSLKTLKNDNHYEGDVILVK